MLPLEPRPIKRPRLSLSCIVCRRRKVRCGREQPKCANCVRMKENCVYKAMARDGFTGQLHQVSPPPQNRGSNEAKPDTKHLTWSHWAPGESDNEIAASDEPPPPARSPNHRQDDTPSCEEVVQRPDDHARGFRSGTASTTPDSSVQASTSASTNHQDGYFSLGRGARVRYIGPAFWGFVAGKESESDHFFDKNRNAASDLPPSHISAIGLFNLLRFLPTKAASDALLEVFIFAVWPLSPLLHCPTLRADYDEFWDYCRNNDTVLPSEKIVDDPTFICLLFAVLYCGASAAPAASWTCADLQDLQKETTVNRLKSAYTTSLSLCQYLDHPTLNTLVSTLLTGPFLDRLREPKSELVSVSTTVRLAQSMGLHREGTSCSALSSVDREIRRRAWWYIVRLDVQLSISTGLPPCCGSQALDTVSMMADTRDEDIGDLPVSLSLSPDTLASKQSVAIVFAIGCSETARLQSRIVASLQSGQAVTQNGLKELVTAAKALQHKIDTLIARIPSQGIPEKGFISSRVANASPYSHPSLYKDDATKPTVFAAWTRIMLTLLKFDIAILLQRPLLPPPDSSDAQSFKTWTSMTKLCVSYCRIILQVYQVPAFSPYRWFCHSYYGPLQCVYLSLIYIRCFKNGREIPLARYCVDEIIEHTVSHYQLSSLAGADPDSESGKGPSKARMPLAIQVLVELHSRLDSHLESNNHSQLTINAAESPMFNQFISIPPSSSISSSSTKAHLQRNPTATARPPMTPVNKPEHLNSEFVTESYSGLDLDRDSIADLDSLSSSLILESNDIFVHPALIASD